MHTAVLSRAASALLAKGFDQDDIEVELATSFTDASPELIRSVAARVCARSLLGRDLEDRERLAPDDHSPRNRGDQGQFRAPPPRPPRNYPSDMGPLAPRDRPQDRPAGRGFGKPWSPAAGRRGPYAFDDSYVDYMYSRPRPQRCDHDRDAEFDFEFGGAGRGRGRGRGRPADFGPRPWAGGRGYGALNREHMYNRGRGQNTGPRGGYGVNRELDREPQPSGRDMLTSLLDARVRFQGDKCSGSARAGPVTEFGALDYVLDLNLSREQMVQARSIVGSSDFETLFCMRLVMSPTEIVRHVGRTKFNNESSGEAKEAFQRILNGTSQEAAEYRRRFALRKALLESTSGAGRDAGGSRPPAAAQHSRHSGGDESSRGSSSSSRRRPSVASPQKRLYTIKLDDLDSIDDLVSKRVSFEKIKIRGKFDNYRLCCSGQLDSTVKNNLFIHQDTFGEIKALGDRLPSFVHGRVTRAEFLRDVKRYGDDVRDCGIVRIDIEMTG